MTPSSFLGSLLFVGYLSTLLKIGATAVRPMRNIFVSKVSDVNLTYVENSGICETTPGVQQISGYVNVGPNMNMWFWFFAARNSPQTAPFTLWLNGGPGCSSMVGLFQENGPCRVTSDGNTTLNPFSWNEVSNMIYIDQPIGTGFSYGNDTVDSTVTAAPYVWQAFQVLFESQLFSQYQSRQFILATESYGGHYGPEFFTYFKQQNALIDSKTLVGEKINIGALLVNNGWIDPLIQNKAYVDFAADAPGYGPLVPPALVQQINASYYEPTGCLAQQQACYAGGNSTTEAVNKTCAQADDFCWRKIGLLAIGDRSPYDLTQNSSQAVPFPPESYVDYLALPSVVSAIGAQSQYSECADEPYERFSSTGDGARTFLPHLAALADSGLRILIWAGDTDIICNWVGVQEVIAGMKWSGQATLASTPLTNMTINGYAVASVQNVGNFSFARVYGAGHEVPAFQPAASLEIFKQIVNGEQLHSVKDSSTGSNGNNALNLRISHSTIAYLLIFSLISLHMTA